MNTAVKITSNQAGVFTAANNRVSFTIPANSGAYDLSEGYVNLVCSVPVSAEQERTSINTNTTNPFQPAQANVAYTSPSTANGSGVYVPQLRLNQDDGSVDGNYYPNACLVKHISMKSGQRGAIEHVKRNDILAANLSIFSKGKDDQTASSYQDAFKTIPISSNKGSLFSDLNKEGTVSSRNLQRQPMRIPLPDVLNFCNVKQYDTSQYGATTVDMELDIGRVRVDQFFGQDHNFQRPNGSDTSGADLGSQNLFQMTNLTPAIGADLTELQLGDGTGTHSQTGTATANYRPFNSIEDVPFHVGQKINVAATYSIGTEDPAKRTVVSTNTILVTRRITEIKFNRGETTTAKTITGGTASKGSVCLVLNAAIDAGGSLTDGASFTNVRVRGAVCTFSPFQVDFAELVVKRISPQNVVPDSGAPIQYTTYETEEFTTAATAELNRMFECPPNCSNLFLFNNGSGGTGQLVSAQGELSSYRIRVDNKDVSDRQIALRESGGTDLSAAVDPLHVQKQIVSLRNSGKQLRNFSERRKQITSNAAVFRNNYATDTVMIAQVLPITPRVKQVQLNLTARAASITRLTMFKEVVRAV